MQSKVRQVATFNVAYLAIQRSNSYKNTTVDSQFKVLPYRVTFDPPAEPRIFCKAISLNGATPIEYRLKGVTNTQFEIQVMEEESLQHTAHKPERVNCLTLPHNINTLGGMSTEIKTFNVDSEQWVLVGDTLNFFASIRSYNGTNPVNIQYKLDAGKYYIKLFEDQSLDEETKHLPETVDVLYFKNTLTATQTNVDKLSYRPEIIIN